MNSAIGSVDNGSNGRFGVSLQSRIRRASAIDYTKITLIYKINASIIMLMLDPGLKNIT